MARSATSRLKVNPPLGNLPALQYLLPAQLKIDPTYQRTLETGPSQTLIRRIAVHWNWDLCQPLVVARRENGDLFVIDGQHRLEAARLRGDIAQLPAVVLQYASAADEAAGFVHLNQQRRPLSKLDVFKAAVASEDAEAVAILAAIEAAGLKLAPHMTSAGWKPGMIGNIGGIEAAWRQHGPVVTARALEVMAAAYPGQVLRYAGTLFPGIAHVIAQERQGCDEEMIAANDAEFMPGFVDVIAAGDQGDWARDIIRLSPEVKGGRREAAQAVFWQAWREFLDAFFDEDEEGAA